MNNLIIVGTIGLDTIETPFGKEKDVLGGSGAYAASAASFFSQPGLCSIVGEDLDEEHLERLSRYRIDLEGIAKGKKNFRWSGFYEYDMNEAKTRKTELNVLAHFQAELPSSYRKARYVFLANIDPRTQQKVLGQLKSRAFVLVDTMNLWIANRPRELKKVLKQADLVLLNDGEARMLFDTPSLVLAAKKTLALGPKYVVIKKGEHGALLFSRSTHFSAPGYPLEQVKDPTGAGDSFAGGLIGYLAKVDRVDEASIRKGIIYGSTIASFCAEDFGLKYRDKIDLAKIKSRYKAFQDIRKF